MRAFAVLLSGIALLGLMFWGLTRLGTPPTPARQVLMLQPVAWSALSGWAIDDTRPTLLAFRRSCIKMLAGSVIRPLGGQIDANGAPLYGRVSDWQDVCAAAKTAPLNNAIATRQWFERNFRPFEAHAIGKSGGLFTGYYEPQLEGSRTRGDGYETPLLKRPEDLVMVDLGEFRDTLKGQRIAGRVSDGQLHPIESRAEIVAGALDANELALAWVKSPVDAFFLQIQGSGRVRLPDRSSIRIGYDGQNGHPYTPIGRVLREMGALERNNISMRTIRDWLDAHPSDASAVMNRNESYVFFRLLDNSNSSLGPEGAQGVALTPGRSLAVDLKFNALGVPMWLETTLPKDEAGTPGEAFRRLMIAQDTGGAITGPIRGDVFFGFGPQAEVNAGRMKQQGKYFALLPRALAETR